MKLILKVNIIKKEIKLNRNTIFQTWIIYKRIIIAKNTSISPEDQGINILISNNSSTLFKYKYRIRKDNLNKFGSFKKFYI